MEKTDTYGKEGHLWKRQALMKKMGTYEKDGNKGLIPRQRNSLPEPVYAEYRWLHMNNFIEFTLCAKKFRFTSE